MLNVSPEKTLRNRMLSKKVRNCFAIYLWKTEIAGGAVIEGYDWTKRVSCDCEPEDDSFCKKNPGTCGVGAGLVILGVAISVCLQPELAPLLVVL